MMIKSTAKRYVHFGVSELSSIPAHVFRMYQGHIIYFQPEITAMALHMTLLIHRIFFMLLLQLSRAPESQFNFVLGSKMQRTLRTLGLQAKA